VSQSATEHREHTSRQKRCLAGVAATVMQGRYSEEGSRPAEPPTMWEERYKTYEGAHQELVVDPRNIQGPVAKYTTVKSSSVLEIIIHFFRGLPM
jgi:hypothetical protein